MFLARLCIEDSVVLAAGDGPGRLVRLDGVDAVTSDDPVGVLRQLGVPGLDAVVQRVRTDEASRWRRVAERAVRFEPPVPYPQKIICVALNYEAHAAEGGQAAPAEPVIFFKPPSALVGHAATVRCPARSSRLEYEVELAVVIGEPCRDVAAADWQRVVLGYTILNDVTARDMQLSAIARGEPWDHSKAFDTFAPCGPYLVTKDQLSDPMQLDLSLRIGDRVLQSSNTRHMTFGIPRLIEVVSAGMSLAAGDIIATGTPSGIRPVADGDVMEAYVEGIGTLANPVVYERRPSPAPSPAG